jgi:hypothetical protein
MVHTNPEFANFKFDSREFDQHLESHTHVINIIMVFRDMGCYNGPVMPRQGGRQDGRGWAVAVGRRRTTTDVGSSRAQVDGCGRAGEVGWRQQQQIWPGERKGERVWAHT